MFKSNFQELVAQCALTPCINMWLYKIFSRMDALHLNKHNRALYIFYWTHAHTFLVNKKLRVDPSKAFFTFFFSRLDKKADASIQKSLVWWIWKCSSLLLTFLVGKSEPLCTNAEQKHNYYSFMFLRFSLVQVSSTLMGLQIKSKAAGRKQRKLKHWGFCKPVHGLCSRESSDRLSLSAGFSSVQNASSS